MRCQIKPHLTNDLKGFQSLNYRVVSSGKKEPKNTENAQDYFNKQVMLKAAQMMGDVHRKLPTTLTREMVKESEKGITIVGGSVGRSGGVNLIRGGFGGLIGREVRIKINPMPDNQVDAIKRAMGRLRGINESFKSLEQSALKAEHALDVISSNVEMKSKALDADCQRACKGLNAIPVKQTFYPKQHRKSKRY